MRNLSFIVGFVAILCLHGATIRPKIDGIPVGLMSRHNIQNINNFVGRPLPTTPQTVPENRDQNSNFEGTKNADNNEDSNKIPVGGEMIFPAPEIVTFSPPNILTSSTKRPTVLRGDISFEIPVFPWSTTTESSITTTENTTTTVKSTIPPATVTHTALSTEIPTTMYSTTETPTRTTTDNTRTTESSITTTESSVKTTQDIPTTTDLLTTTAQATTETVITTAEPTEPSSSTVVTPTTTVPTSTPETVTVTTKTAPITTEVTTSAQEITTVTAEPTTQTTSVPVTITSPTTYKPLSTSTSIPATTTTTFDPSSPPTNRNEPIIPDVDFEDFLDFGDDSDDSDDDDDFEDNDDLGFWLGDDGEDEFKWWNGLFGARVSDNFKLSARPRTEVATVRDIISMPARNQVKNEEIASKIDNLLDTLYFNSKSWLYVVNEGGLPQKQKLLKKFDSFMNSVYKKLSNKFLKLVNHSNGKKNKLH